MLEDESAGFRAIGGVFGWRRGYDLLAQGGLRFGRGAGPAVALNHGQADAAVEKLLRQFYGGLLGYDQLRFQVLEVLEQLPVVESGALGEQRQAEPHTAPDSAT